MAAVKNVRTLRMTDATWRNLKRLADQEGRSVSNYIELVLAIHLRHQQQRAEQAERAG